MEPELAKEVSGPGTLASPTHETDRRHARGRGDHIAHPDDVAALAVAVAVEAVWQPAPTVHGGLVTSLDHRPGELRNALDCSSAHHECGTQPRVGEGIKKAPYPHTHPVVEHLLLHQIAYSGRQD